MDHRKFADELRAILEELRQRGQTAIPIENLAAYLTEVMNATDEFPPEVALERHKAELQQWNDSQQRAHEIDLENFKVVVAAGQSAIRTMLLINGGAAIAMLAYLGNLAGSHGPNMHPFALAMAPFGVGVLIAGTCSGLTYLTQFMYAQAGNWTRRAGHVLNGLAIATGAAGFGAFGLGMWWTYTALAA